MQEVNGSSLFDLGQVYNLALLQLGPIKENRLIPERCVQILREFVGMPFSYRLPHTVQQSNMIADELERWINTPDAEVTQDGRFTIIRNLDQLRTLLFSELGKLTAILLEDIRGYSVDALWRNPLNLLPDGIAPLLSDFVTENFAEAAKCLVLERYTAVGFHAMRSVEFAARKYYELIIGKPPIIIHAAGKPQQKEQNMGLGQIVNDLLVKFTSRENHKPRKETSGDLGIIATTIHALCKNYRDPLSHPDIKKLDMNQAATSLNQTIEVISSIVMDAKNGGGHFTTPWASDPF